MATIDDIREFAVKFRKAIERCPRAALPISFEEFPQGSCGDATLLLSKYLEENGHAGFIYICGMRDGNSHAWLRREDLIVDITADQFPDQHQPVIVRRRSSWHASFKEGHEHHSDFERYDAVTAASLRSAYVEIMKHLDNRNGIGR